VILLEHKGGLYGASSGEEEGVVTRRACISAAAISALVVFMVSVSDGAGAAKAEKTNG
jgi:hypothetical protein